MKTCQERYDAICIGSGISALTTAALLSKKGKKVLVLEQYVKPGGYMHCFSRFGEQFDTGAHYMGALGEGQPFRVLLEYLGVWREGLFAPLDPSGFDVMYFPEGPVEIPRGYAEVAASLSSRFPGERGAIEKYFTLIRTISSCFPTYNFNDRPEGSFPPEALDRSLRDIVEGLTQHNPLKSVLYSYCSLHGVRPEDVSFGFHAIVTDSLIRGPYGLNGGGDALTAEFIKVISRNGGEVRCREKVVGLAVKDREVSRVVTEKGEYQAEWIVSSLHPKATFRLLDSPELFPPVFKQRLANIKESPGIFGMYAVFHQRPAIQPDRNYYYFRSSDPRDMFAATNPGETPPVVFQSSPKRSWDGNEQNFPQSLHVAAPYEWFAAHREETYGRRSKAYKDLKLRIADSVWNAVERYQPATSNNVKAFHTSTPLTHLHFNGSEEGSSYGIYHSMHNTGAKALGPRTKVLNLLLTGQSCLFPGLLGAATSGLRTAGHVLKIKPILQDLQRMGAQA